MAFKEGVTDEQVNKWRVFLKSMVDLDQQVDTGVLTPEEAIAKATKGPEKPKAEEKPKVAESEPVPHRTHHVAGDGRSHGR